MKFFSNESLQVIFSIWNFSIISMSQDLQSLVMTYRTKTVHAKQWMGKHDDDDDDDGGHNAWEASMKVASSNFLGDH